MALFFHCHLLSDCEPDWGCSIICKVRFDTIDMNGVLLQAFRRFLFFYIQNNVGLNFVLSVGFCIGCYLGLEACWRILFG